MLRLLLASSSLTRVSQLLLPLLILVFAAGSTIGVFAQESTWRAREGLPVGSESERYLRVLQLAGKAPLHPWTVRGLAPSELHHVLPVSTEHPWREIMDFTLESPKGLEFGLIRPRLKLLSNSAYPFGEDDGALWAGKGLSAAIDVGAFSRLGPLHLRFAPEGFWTENAPFDLADNGKSGAAAYRDEQRPGAIDRPQRFGEKAYTNLGLGSSAVHLALPGITVGVSGAGQHWGPARRYPLLLGNNSGGFLHVFGQTTSLVDLWALRLRGRYILGWPKQSDFSPVVAAEHEHQRFATGAALAILPRGIDGLEIGMARFIHTLLPSEIGIRREDLLRVFTGVTQESENLSSRNQLFSLFFRWTVPAAGVELYGELVKEDFVRDLRHAIEEPDDLMGKVLGFRKLWLLSRGRFAVLSGEWVSSQLHHSERFGRFQMWDSTGNSAGQIPFPLYIHGGGVGHTHLGQLLASPTAYGGSGWTLEADLYDKTGRWSAGLSRALQTDFSAIHSGTVGPKISDVIYSLKLEAVRFHNEVEWSFVVTPSLNLNRNLLLENDVFNLSLSLSMKRLPW